MIGSSDRFAGLLIGTAVGDALGLAAEGMSRRRIQRRWHGAWKYRFFFSRGMVSDDTDHALLVAQALLAYPDDPRAFQRCLAWKLRFWLLGAPAGVGLATLRAILKLWLGFSPDRSGVYSAGNGPAMRSAIIGAYFADAPEKRRAFVSASTRLTHTDPKAETAALAIAEAVAWAINQNESIETWLMRLSSLSNDKEWQVLCKQLVNALDSSLSVENFAASLGLQNGVTGYAYHSIPVALYAALRHAGDFRPALEAALNCGGDTDTVGAMVGAISGARLGRNGVPDDLIGGLWEWPRSVAFMECVAGQLGDSKQSNRHFSPVRYFWPGLILRNVLFALVVLAHGFRRLLPPY